MSPDSILFLVLLLIIAVLYSSVGHGGASGYLALMGLFHFAPDVMRPAALVLNLLVSFIAWWQYSRKAALQQKLFLWLIIGSVPAAFAGSLISLDVSLYKQMLGVLLLIPALRMFGFFKPENQVVHEPRLFPAVTFGVVIGLLSGVIGIGGGIILSPLLLMLGWSDIRQTAHLSALFIFVNSLTGIIGLSVNDVEFHPDLPMWCTIAVIGGLVGSVTGSRKASPTTLTHILGVVLIIAGLKLLIL